MLSQALMFLQLLPITHNDATSQPIHIPLSHQLPLHTVSEKKKRRDDSYELRVAKGFALGGEVVRVCVHHFLSFRSTNISLLCSLFKLDFVLSVC